MSRQEQVQDALLAASRGDRQPCVGCVNSSACADLELACRAFYVWVQGVPSFNRSREPSRRMYLLTMTGEEE